MYHRASKRDIRRTLRAARHLTGLTQQQLADEIGVAQPVLAKWELGKHRPSDASWKKIRAAFKRHNVQFVFGDRRITLITHKETDNE